MNGSLQIALMRAWYIRTGTILRDPSAANNKDPYAGMQQCMRNVVRANTNKKLRYCIATV